MLLHYNLEIVLRALAFIKNEFVLTLFTMVSDSKVTNIYCIYNIFSHLFFPSPQYKIIT
jgi:hypothetical protein